LDVPVGTTRVFFLLIFLFYRQYWSLPSGKVFFSEAGLDWIGAMTQARTSAQPSAGLAGGHKQLLHEEQGHVQALTFCVPAVPEFDLVSGLPFPAQ
jgi:hypothetical protein